MIDPADLAVRRTGPYVYKSALKRRAAGALDRLGDLLLAPRPAAVPWAAVRRVAVLRLDHLGDVLFALPALRALRRALPAAQVDLFVGPWGREAAGLGRAADRLHVFDAPWFWRPRRVEWPWKAIAGLAGELRRGDFDLGIDLRGDLRHGLALWASGIPWRAGHTLTAGRFLLTHPVEARPGLHEVEQNLSLLSGLGLPGGGAGPALPRVFPPSAAAAEAGRLWKELGLGVRVVAAQAASGAASKLWPEENWARLLDGLPRGFQAVLLGSGPERPAMERLARRCRRRPALATGRLGLGGLAAFLKRCRLLVSLDSGPAHLAAAVGTPVLALYSGTNLLPQWGPRGSRVEAIQKAPACSPCELAACPLDNACMRAIGADEALAAVRRMLK